MNRNNLLFFVIIFIILLGLFFYPKSSVLHNTKVELAIAGFKCNCFGFTSTKEQNDIIKVTCYGVPINCKTILNP